MLDVPLSLVSLAACLEAAEELVGAAKEETEAATGVLDEAETEALKNSLGVGARGPGVAASRGGAGQLKELERRQKSRATRIGRDSLDRALVDLAGLYRDALVLAAAPSDGCRSTIPTGEQTPRSWAGGSAGGRAAAHRRPAGVPHRARAERQAAGRHGGADGEAAPARLRTAGPPRAGGGAVS